MMEFTKQDVDWLIGTVEISYRSKYIQDKKYKEFLENLLKKLQQLKKGEANETTPL